MRRSRAVYRMVFGQPRQDDLLSYLFFDYTILHGQFFTPRVRIYLRNSFYSLLWLLSLRKITFA